MPSGTRPQPPVGTARVAIDSVLSGNTCANVVWFDLTSAGSPNAGDLNFILGAFIDAWITRFKPYQAAQVTYLGANASWLHAAGQAIETAVTRSVVCTGGTTVHDAGASIVVDWGINAYYRGGHPRTYLPGVVDSNTVNSSSLDPTYRSAIATAAGGVLSDVAALSHGDITAVKLGTVTFQTGKEWRPSPFFRQYVSAKVRSRMGTQRRRLRTG